MSGFQATRLTFCFLTTSLAMAQEPSAVQPVRVCAILQDPGAYAGKLLAVVGRFSFRHDGRFLSEEACNGGRAVMPVGFDQKLAPKTPEHLEIDAASVTKLLKQVQQTTALAKFRFGTPDYDRWAVVYGRIEPTQRNPADAGRVELICAGDSVVMFIVDRY